MSMIKRSFLSFLLIGVLVISSFLPMQGENWFDSTISDTEAAAILDYPMKNYNKKYFQWDAVSSYMKDKYGRPYHLGVDFSSESDKNIYSIGDGVVVKIGYESDGNGNGNHIFIRYDGISNSKTVYALYAHLKSINVSVNQVVNKGTIVGIEGQTGSANGINHLHFAIIDSLNGYWGYGSSPANGSVNEYLGVHYYDPYYVIQNGCLPDEVEKDSNYDTNISITASEYINCYYSVNGTQRGRIYPDDPCTIIEVYTNGWCKVNGPFPDTEHMEIVYCKTDEFQPTIPKKTSESYQLDINGFLDGNTASNTTGYGTFDLYVNGTLVADDAVDFCDNFPSGSTWEIKDVKTTSGKEFLGAHDGNVVYSTPPGGLTGTLDRGYEVVLKFATAQNGSSVEERIFNFLTNEMGYNTAAACGILANIEYESGFRTDVYGDGGTSYGICQWHNGRMDNMISHCASLGLDKSSLEGQLSYLKTELSGSQSGLNNVLKNVPNNSYGAFDAGFNWCWMFEVPASIDAQSEKRAIAAKSKYWEKYKTKASVSQDFEVSGTYDSSAVITADKNISAYASAEGVYVGRVYAGDVCTVKYVFTNGWVQLICPWKSGYKRYVYVKLEDVATLLPEIPLPDYQLDPEYGTNISVVATDYTTAYSSIKGSRCGRVYPGDVCTVSEVYANGWCKVLCPWSDGSVKTIYCITSEFKPEIPKVGSPKPLIVDTAYDTNIAITASEYINCYTDTNYTVNTSTKRIYPNDSCVILEVYTNGWCKVSAPFPDAANMKTVYCRTDEFRPEIPKKQVTTYQLDINGFLDGEYATGISGFGTFDLYVDGKCVADDAEDFCENFPAGSTWEIRDVKPAVGKEFLGAHDGNVTYQTPPGGLTGTFNRGYEVVLKFDSHKYSVKVDPNGGTLGGNIGLTEVGYAIYLSSEYGWGLMAASPQHPDRDILLRDIIPRKPAGRWSSELTIFLFRPSTGMKITGISQHPIV